MPATCEYASVTVRLCSPRSAGVDGKVTAKLAVLSQPDARWFWFGPIDGRQSKPEVTCTDTGGCKAFVADLRSFGLTAESGFRRACEPGWLRSRKGV
jgi:hypothetical protein